MAPRLLRHADSHRELPQRTLAAAACLAVASPMPSPASSSSPFSASYFLVQKKVSWPAQDMQDVNPKRKGDQLCFWWQGTFPMQMRAIRGLRQTLKACIKVPC